MIGRLTGRLVSCSPGHVLLDVNGVGYDLLIPLSTYYTFASAAESPISLHVHTHVREDALQLFGFATPAERVAFGRLIAVAGVGPRTALAILSGIGVSELCGAVRVQDRARLEKIPGIGKKTAERLLLELKDKLDALDRPSEGQAGPRSASAPTEAASLRDDARSALVNLGYSSEVAGRAVDRALAASASSPTLERLLRSALAGLVR